MAYCKRGNETGKKRADDGQVHIYFGSLIEKSIEQIMTLNYSFNSFMKHGHLRLMNAYIHFQ